MGLPDKKSQPVQFFVIHCTESSSAAPFKCNYKNAHEEEAKQKIPYNIIFLHQTNADKKYLCQL